MENEDKNKGGDPSKTSVDETAKGENGREGAEKKTPDGDEDYHAAELARLQGEGDKGGSKYTPLERATHSARKIADEIKKYGGDPASIFGAAPTAKKDDKGGSDDGKEGVDLEKVSKLVDERLGKFQSGFVSQQAQGLIRSVSKSDSEATLIQYHLENTIRPTGNMEEDVKRAYLIANHGKILQNMELFKSQAGKKTQKPSDPGQKSTQGKEPTSAQKELMHRKGLKWDADKGEVFSPARRAYQEKSGGRKR